MVERGIMKVYMWMALMPLIVMQFFKNLDTDKKKKRYCVICGIILIVVLGTRNRFLGSTDSLNYYNMMKQAISAASWNEFYIEGRVETGFQIFLWMLSRVLKNPQWILFVSAAIYVTCNLVFIYKNSKNICLSITIYICLGLMLFNMQGMRQSIAMSICLISYEYAKNKKFIPFVALVMLATAIHQTAVVFYIVYLLSYLKIKPIHIFLVLVGIVVVLFLSEKIISSANELFDREYNDVKETGGFVATAIYFLIIGFYLYFSKRPLKDNMDEMMFYMLIVGVVCYIERYIGALAAERISFYFAAAQTIVLPNTICDGRIAEREKKTIYTIVYFLCIALFAYRLSGSNLVPFRFFWEV